MENILPKISVIIPVYKVEQYLRKCVESVLNQTYKNLEIILVNDGSPDNCGQICDEFLAKDSRVKVLHQENQGLSMARNNGVDLATGVYIGFVDSDDYLLPKMYEIMLDTMIKYKVKVVECSYRKGENIYYDQKSDDVYEQTFDEAVKRIDKPGFYNVMNKLYELELIKDIRFIKGKIYEDTLFTSEVWKKIDKIGFVPKALYVYSQEGESIIRSAYDQKKLEGFWVSHQAMENLMKNSNNETTTFLLSKNFLDGLLFHFHSLMKNKDLDPKNIELMKMHNLIRKNLKTTGYINLRYSILNTIPLKMYAFLYTTKSRLTDKFVGN
ncbi:glycosyltransferase family 2 protein [Spongiimicrobium sp. 3-5]|uniref:glycosyltransferase family 2 protein n=1 Tax=Spongiimicrobium sp. 3-5 TaxID=3332596 RepID=UPI00397FB431